MKKKTAVPKASRNGSDLERFRGKTEAQIKAMLELEYFKFRQPQEAEAFIKARFDLLGLSFDDGNAVLEFARRAEANDPHYAYEASEWYRLHARITEDAKEYRAFLVRRGWVDDLERRFPILTQEELAVMADASITRHRFSDAADLFRKRRDAAGLRRVLDAAVKNQYHDTPFIEALDKELGHPLSVRQWEGLVGKMLSHPSEDLCMLLVRHRLTRLYKPFLDQAVSKKTFVPFSEIMDWAAKMGRRLTTKQKLTAYHKRTSDPISQLEVVRELAKTSAVWRKRLPEVLPRAAAEALNTGCVKMAERYRQEYGESVTFDEALNVWLLWRSDDRDYHRGEAQFGLDLAARRIRKAFTQNS